MVPRLIPALGIACVLAGGSSLLARAFSHDRATGRRAPASQSARMQPRTPSPAARAAWEYVRKNHPHGLEPGWTDAPFSAGPATCTPDPNTRYYFFIRTVPENGAMGLDWAEVSWKDEQVTEMESRSGPAFLPEDVRRPPALTAAQAWRLAAQELRACGCRLPRRYRAVPPTFLRLIETEERIRLTYCFTPKRSGQSISVDAVSGEVGGMGLVFAMPVVGDPLWPRTPPRRGHNVRRLLGWVAGAPSPATR